MKKMAYPYLIWLIIFIMIPILLVGYFAITEGNSINFTEFEFSLNNFKRFFTPTYMKVLLKSIRLAGLSTLICLIIGYPLAYIIANENESRKNVLILLLVIPMWMNFLLRTYSWLSILGRNGFINNILVKLGLQPLKLLYTEKAVLMGMVYNFLPFMVLPIHSVLVKIDKSIIEAGKDLGARPFDIFIKIIFPLSISGVISGVTMVFIPAVSTFVISNLLGGNKYNLIGNIIEHQFRYTGDWHFGSSMSMILMIFILITMGLMNRLDVDYKKGGK